MKLELFSSLEPLELSVDYHLTRHGVLAANLANADTPGFQPSDVVFNPTATATELERTDPTHLAGQESTPNGMQFVMATSPPGVDKNGVRLEEAMAQISANRLRYDAGIELLRRRLALLRYAATDGGM